MSELKKLIPEKVKIVIDDSVESPTLTLNQSSYAKLLGNIGRLGSEEMQLEAWKFEKMFEGIA